MRHILRTGFDKTQFNHGWTRIPGRPRKTAVHQRGEYKPPSEIRVNPFASVVLTFDSFFGPAPHPLLFVLKFGLKFFAVKNELIAQRFLLFNIAGAGDLAL